MRQTAVEKPLTRFVRRNKQDMKRIEELEARILGC